MGIVDLVGSGPVGDGILVLLSTVLIWLGSVALESASENLATHYEMPSAVRGAVFLALGSSFPELVTVVVAGLLGVFELGIGAIVGSAIFNILVIPALAGITTRSPVTTNKDVLYKETQFYIIAILTITLTFALAVLYFPVSAGGTVGRLTPQLVAIPLGLYGLYLIIQVWDTQIHHLDIDVEDVDVWRSWAMTAGGLLAILVGVHQLVGIVGQFEQHYGIPHFLGGVVFLAAATSIPDAFVSVRSARHDDGIACIANVLGSNTLDLLVAIPIGVLLVGGETVDFAIAVPVIVALLLTTVLFFIFARTGYRVTVRESYVMLLTYAGFLLWIVAETTNISNIIGPV